jgi:hypothetical protein
VILRFVKRIFRAWEAPVRWVERLDQRRQVFVLGVDIGPLLRGLANVAVLLWVLAPVAIVFVVLKLVGVVHAL